MIARFLFVLGLFCSFSVTALANEEEFQKKIQEDMDEYKDRVKSACDADVAFKWEGGKLGKNPRETNITTYCTSGIATLVDVCNESKAFKKEAKNLKKVTCKLGKGTLGYTMSKSTVTFSVDNSFEDKNASDQMADLRKKILAAH